MTISRTPAIKRSPKGITQDLQPIVGDVLRSAVRAADHQSLAMVAAAVGRDPSLVEDWASGDKPLPVYALIHPGVSRTVRAAIVGWIVSQLESDVQRASIELSTTNVLRVVGELLAAVAPMLSDGQIDESEREMLVKYMTRLHCLSGDWLAQHGGEK